MKKSTFILTLLCLFCVLVVVFSWLYNSDWSNWYHYVCPRNATRTFPC